MSETLEQRACELAVYMIETGATVRAAAKHFHISKSTVHKDLSQRLPKYNQVLYTEVRKILEQNKQERHMRGGEATRMKYIQRRISASSAKNSRKPRRPS